MEIVRFRSSDVERCTGCKGIWFDVFETSQLQNLPGSEEIDVGAGAETQPPGETARLPCPKCGGGQLIRMADLKNAKVSFYTCGVCGGSFFEAGEFRRLKKKP